MSTISLRLLTLSGLSLPSTRRTVLALLISGMDRLHAWQERSSQRRALAALSDHQLKDIGVSRADVVHEAGKPFWRP